MGDFQMNSVLQAYLEAALWASVDSNEESLDKHYSIDDIDELNIEEQEEQLNDFFNRAKDCLEGLDRNQVARDFFLTRNGHSSGFFDGDYQDLIELSNLFGPTDLYVGNDGLLYFG